MARTTTGSIRKRKTGVWELAISQQPHKRLQASMDKLEAFTMQPSRTRPIRDDLR